MAQWLRQVVAAPRVRHEDTGLDLCYVTENIIATSGPSQSYPSRAYRTPLEKLVKFLDEQHGEKWAIWEFRAEGTGYPDDAVYGRIHHFPWPDHHPPPFRLVPLIMGTMRNWLKGEKVTGRDAGFHTRKGLENFEEGGGKFTATSATTATAKSNCDTIAESAKESELAPNSSEPDSPGVNFVQPKSILSKTPEPSPRVVVVHCKAGKGRSGSMSVSYLISECGWTKAEAMKRFTERRMLPGFGSGVSIPSQVRWIDYVERWAASAPPSTTEPGAKRRNDNTRKVYLDRPVEVVEVHCWGLRNGVKVELEGFVDNGRRIKVFHTFSEEERIITESGAPGGAGVMDMVRDMMGEDKDEKEESADVAKDDSFRSKESEVSGDGDVRKSEIRVEGAQGQRQNEDEWIAKKRASNLLRKGKNAAKVIAQLSKSAAISGRPNDKLEEETPKTITSSPGFESTRAEDISHKSATEGEPGGKAVIFRPQKRIIMETSDVNISLERRSRTPGPSGAVLSVTTAIAHAWFNAFFEGQGPERMAENAGATGTSINGTMDDGLSTVENKNATVSGLASSKQLLPLQSGIFSINWEAMDGVKGSKKKGVRAADRVDVLWRVITDEEERAGTDFCAGKVEETMKEEGGAIKNKSKVGKNIIKEPAPGDVFEELQPADWRGEKKEVIDPDAKKRLGGVSTGGDHHETRNMRKKHEKAITEDNDSEKGKIDDENGENQQDESDDMEDLGKVKSAGPKGEKIQKSVI